MARVAYEDWTPEFQELWDEMPVDWAEMPGPEYDMAEYMFEEGFMHYHGEASYADISFARESFFDLIGYDEDYFDWDGWREAMGYE